MFACTPTCCVCADATLNPAHASVWRKRYILGFAGLNVGQVRVHNNKNKQGYNQWQDTGGHQCSSSFQHKLPAGLLGKPDDSERRNENTGYWHTTTAGLRGGSLEHFVTKNLSLLNVMKYLFVWGNSELWQNVSKKISLTGLTNLQQDFEAKWQQLFLYLQGRGKKKERKSSENISYVHNQVTFLLLELACRP